MGEIDLEKSKIFDIAISDKDEVLNKIKISDKKKLEDLYYRVKKEIIENQEKRQKENEENKKDAEEHPIISSAFNILGKISGFSGFGNWVDSFTIKDECELLKNISEELNITKKKEINYKLQEFGEYKIETLKNTLGQFLAFLKEMEQKNKFKEYEILSEININIEEFNKTFDFTMKASEAIEGTIKSTGLAIAGSTIAPQLAMGGVMAWGTASTGTAISTLSGAAATNAALAALGGGSIASGGGGIAAGTALLGTVGSATGGIVAIIYAGSIASKHFSKKLAEAVEYENAVLEYTTKIEKGWEVMGLIYKRIDELYAIMQNLEKRIYNMFELFEPLVSDFNYQDVYQAKTFQKTGLLIKSISEIANTSILNNEGNMSEDTNKLIKKVEKVTNEDLIDE